MSPSALAAQARWPLAAQPLHGAVLGPARHAQPLRAVQRRHLDHRAADRLGDRQRDLDLEVVAERLNTGESPTRVITNRSPGSPGPARSRPRLALAGQPNPAAVPDAGREVDPQPADARAARPSRGTSDRDRRSRCPTRGSSSTAGRSRRSPGSAPRFHGPRTPGRRAGSCPAWRRCRGTSDTARTSGPGAGSGRRSPPGRVQRRPRSRGRGRAGRLPRPPAFPRAAGATAAGAPTASEDVGEDVAEAAPE